MIIIQLLFNVMEFTQTNLTGDSHIKQYQWIVYITTQIYHISKNLEKLNL